MKYRNLSRPHFIPSTVTLKRVRAKEQTWQAFDDNWFSLTYVYSCLFNTIWPQPGFGEIIEFVANHWTLEPGDVITAATPPAGPIDLGHVIEADIKGIGVLRNPVEGMDVDLKYAQQIDLKEFV